MAWLKTHPWCQLHIEVGHGYRRHQLRAMKYEAAVVAYNIPATTSVALHMCKVSDRCTRILARNDNKKHTTCPHLIRCALTNSNCKNQDRLRKWNILSQTVLIANCTQLRGAHRQSLANRHLQIPYVGDWGPSLIAECTELNCKAVESAQMLHESSRLCACQGKNDNMQAQNQKIHCI